MTSSGGAGAPAQPDFVHSLSSLLSDVGEDPMTRDEQDEVNRRCDEIRASRARAEVTGRDYLIL